MSFKLRFEWHEKTDRLDITGQLLPIFGLSTANARETNAGLVLQNKTQSICWSRAMSCGIWRQQCAVIWMQRFVNYIYMDRSINWIHFSIVSQYIDCNIGVKCWCFRKFSYGSFQRILNDLSSVQISLSNANETWFAVVNKARNQSSCALA